jgi:hypothetical protein
MKAKKKPMEKLEPSELGVDLTPRLETLKVEEPAKRVGGGKVCVFMAMSLNPHADPMGDCRWRMWTSWWRSSRSMASRRPHNHKHKHGNGHELKRI